MHRHPLAQVRQSHMAIHQQVVKHHGNQHQIAHHRQRHAATDAKRRHHRGQGAVRQAIGVFCQPRFQPLGIEFNREAPAQQHRLKMGFQLVEQLRQLHLDASRLFEQHRHYQGHYCQQDSDESGFADQHQYAFGEALAQPLLQTLHHRRQHIGHDGSD